ncbi:hypothetical protein [Sodalis sp.]|uniref:hypothetical protein n=1 Tax=Sodalis sp. (in: enterobacteria) TaxID=1898979 RepID=UPI003873AF36
MVNIAAGRPAALIPPVAAEMPYRGPVLPHRCILARGLCVATFNDHLAVGAALKQRFIDKTEKFSGTARSISDSVQVLRCMLEWVNLAESSARDHVVYQAINVVLSRSQSHAIAAGGCMTGDNETSGMKAQHCQRKLAGALPSVLCNN